MVVTVAEEGGAETWPVGARALPVTEATLGVVLAEPETDGLIAVNETEEVDGEAVAVPETVGA